MDENDPIKTLVDRITRERCLEDEVVVLRKILWLLVADGGGVMYLSGKSLVANVPEHAVLQILWSDEHHAYEFKAVTK